MSRWITTIFPNSSYLGSWWQGEGLYSVLPSARSSPHTVLEFSSVLGARAGAGDPCWALGLAHHLLTPLPLAGLLEAPAGGLYGQRAGGHGGQQAAAAVHGEGEVHGGLHHHLQGGRRVKEGEVHRGLHHHMKEGGECDLWLGSY